MLQHGLVLMGRMNSALFSGHEPWCGLGLGARIGGQRGWAHSGGLSPGKDLRVGLLGCFPRAPEIDGASQSWCFESWTLFKALKRPEGPRPPGPCPRPCPRPPLQPASRLPRAHARVLFWVLEVRLTGSARALGLGRYGFCLLARVCKLFPRVCPSSVARGQHLSRAGRRAVSLAGVPLPPRPPLEPSAATYELRPWSVASVILTCHLPWFCTPGPGAEHPQ